MLIFTLCLVVLPIFGIHGGLRQMSDSYYELLRSAGLASTESDESAANPITETSQEYDEQTKEDRRLDFQPNFSKGPTIIRNAMQGVKKLSDSIQDKYDIPEVVVVLLKAVWELILKRLNKDGFITGLAKIFKAIMKGFLVFLKKLEVVKKLLKAVM